MNKLLIDIEFIRSCLLKAGSERTRRILEADLQKLEEERNQIIGTSSPIWRSWGSSGREDDGRDARSPRWTSWGGEEAIIFGRGRTRWTVRRSWRCTGWSRARRTGRSSRGRSARGTRRRGGESFSGNDEWEHSRIYLENISNRSWICTFIGFCIFWQVNFCNILYFCILLILTSQFQ